MDFFIQKVVGVILKNLKNVSIFKPGQPSSQCKTITNTDARMEIILERLSKCYLCLKSVHTLQIVLLNIFVASVWANIMYLFVNLTKRKMTVWVGFTCFTANCKSRFVWFWQQKELYHKSFLVTGSRRSFITENLAKY